MMSLTKLTNWLILTNKLVAGLFPVLLCSGEAQVCQSGVTDICLLFRSFTFTRGLEFK